MELTKPLCLVPKNGKPIPQAQIESIEDLLRDARAGIVSGFVFCAVGPDFVRWRDGYVYGTGDRHNLIGQLMMAIRQIEDLEVG